LIRVAFSTDRQKLKLYLGTTATAASEPRRCRTTAEAVCNLPVGLHPAAPSRDQVLSITLLCI